MPGLWRFLLYNVLASLAAGLVAWGVVWAALRLLRARSAFLHTSFLALPLVKSILVLLGIGLVLPVKGWLDTYGLVVPPRFVLPFALAWLAVSLAVYYALTRRARARLISGARTPTGEEGFRFNAALVCVLSAYRQSPCCEAGETICCISDKVPESPLLLVSETLRSPTALVSGGRPAVIFPAALVTRLDDAELALALAHELNHFAVRKPILRASGGLWLLMLVSPIAFLLAGYLHREEEKACDDLAVKILGQADVFAGMLLKSYQFARERRRASRLKPLPLLPQLLGYKTFLAERVERLLEPSRPGAGWLGSPLIIYPVWIVILYLLFFAHFAA